MRMNSRLTFVQTSLSHALIFVLLSLFVTSKLYCQELERDRSESEMTPAEKSIRDGILKAFRTDGELPVEEMLEETHRMNRASKSRPPQIPEPVPLLTIE